MVEGYSFRKTYNERLGLKHSWNDFAVDVSFLFGCRPAEVLYTTNVLIPLKL